MGKPLTLQLEHMNGDREDNKIENLEFLCPNCRSQTSTFGAKNIGRSTKTLTLKDLDETDTLLKKKREETCVSKLNPSISVNVEELYRHSIENKEPFPSLAKKLGLSIKSLKSHLIEIGIHQDLTPEFKTK